MNTLRELTPNDVVEFRRLRLLGLQESPAAFGASFAQDEKIPLEELAKRLNGTVDRWVLGVFSEAYLVGVVGFMRDTGDKLRHKGFLWGMYVDPGFRGKGMARDLLSAALSRTDATPGLRCVRLSVVTSNSKAVCLYKRFGFYKYGEEEDALYVDGVFHSEFHMMRISKNEPNK